MNIITPPDVSNIYAIVYIGLTKCGDQQYKICNKMEHYSFHNFLFIVQINNPSMKHEGVVAFYIIQLSLNHPSCIQINLESFISALGIHLGHVIACSLPKVDHHASALIAYIYFSG